jgi:hypothetical protein
MLKRRALLSGLQAHTPVTWPRSSLPQAAGAFGLALQRNPSDRAPASSAPLRGCWPRHGRGGESNGRMVISSNNRDGKWSAGIEGNRRRFGESSAPRRSRPGLGTRVARRPDGLKAERAYCAVKCLRAARAGTRNGLDPAGVWAWLLGSTGRRPMPSFGWGLDVAYPAHPLESLESGAGVEVPGSLQADDIGRLPAGGHLSKATAIRPRTGWS